MGNAYLRSAPYYPPLNAEQLMSNFITNSFNGVAIANPSVTVAGTQNWLPSPTGPIVGGLDQNPIAGADAGSISFNPFATLV